MGLIDKLHAEALHEVTAGGIEWRIRRASAADLAAAKHVELLVLDRESLLMPAPQTIEEAVDQAVARARKVPPAGIAKLRAADTALLSASVFAAREPGGKWEPIRIVGPDEPSNHDTGALSVRDLPPGVEALLVGEAGAWATGGTAGVEALRAFRDGTARDAAPDAPAGDGVQPEALRVVAGG